MLNTYLVNRVDIKPWRVALSWFWLRDKWASTEGTVPTLRGIGRAGTVQSYGRASTDDLVIPILWVYQRLLEFLVRHVIHVFVTLIASVEHEKHNAGVA